MKRQYQILISGLLFLGCLSVFFLYANSDYEIKIWGWTLKKSDELKWPKKKQNIPPPKMKTDSIVVKNIPIDTTPQRFLLIGDSQIEGLQFPFYDYCVKNGHKLTMACTWYSSTDMTYAYCDTLRNLIKKYKPTHIVIAIGLNQTFQTRFNETRAAIDSIKNMFDTIHYSWIGPANWVADKGINAVYQEKVDSGCFFLSVNIKLPRAKDGRHPNDAGYKIWMDSIANWMQHNSRYRIKMAPPDSVQKQHPYESVYYNVQE